MLPKVLEVCTFFMFNRCVAPNSQISLIRGHRFLTFLFLDELSPGQQLGSKVYVQNELLGDVHMLYAE